MIKRQAAKSMNLMSGIEAIRPEKQFFSGFSGAGFFHSIYKTKGRFVCLMILFRTEFDKAAHCFGRVGRIIGKANSSSPDRSLKGNFNQAAIR